MENVFNSKKELDSLIALMSSPAPVLPSAIVSYLSSVEQKIIEIYSLGYEDGFDDGAFGADVISDLKNDL